MPAVSRFFLRWLVVSLACGSLAPALRAQNDPESRREAIGMMYPLMIAALEAKNYNRARHICDQAILWEPQNPVHHYNLACIEAQTGPHRLAQAMSALELSIALGFDEPEHLQNDPDLVPLRRDPKFKELVRKADHNASARDALSTFAVPPPRASTRPEPPAAATPEQPAPAVLRDGVPVGLYLMSRYPTDVRAVEHAIWYFAPDGTVYRGLDAGFSQDDLASHPGPKGKAVANGDTLTITWPDGGKTASELEPDGAGFTWDMGIFQPVASFADRSVLPGKYRAAGEPETNVVHQLEFRSDGTFTWETARLGPASAGAKPEAAPANTVMHGGWRLDGFSAVLTDAEGGERRHFAAPIDDEATVVSPDQMFLGKIMFKRQP